MKKKIDNQPAIGCILTSSMLKNFIKKLVARENLTSDEAHEAMGYIMEGLATPAQIAALVIALRMKGETVDEVAGMARSMRQHATTISPKASHLVDTCGTGGDAAGTFNISTTAAFVAAGAGASVAKHGNRAASSRCGSADLLVELGVRIDLSPELIEESIEKIGFGFIFAPLFHASMKHALPARQEIGVRNVFNILGPLANPSTTAPGQILGVYEPRLTELMANVLKQLGSKYIFVVHGHDGLDEISTTTETKVSRLIEGKVETYYLDARNFGLPRVTLEELKGGSVQENAEITLDILAGKEKGPKRDIVLINAAAALVVSGLAQDLNAGMKLARRSVETGAAREKLEQVRQFGLKHK